MAETSSDTAPPTSNVIGPDAIGVVVTDMARSVRFYRSIGVTGLPDDPGTEDHVEGVLAGGFRLMLDTEEMIRSFSPDFDPGTGGRLSLAVQCSSADAVDQLYAQLDAEGHGHLPPWDAFWGQRYASVRDPDGTQVDLYAALPGQPAGP